MPRLTSPLLAITVVAISLGGCAGATSTRTVTVTTTVHAARRSHQKHRHAEAPTHRRHRTEAASDSGPSFRRCDQNIAAEASTTSCGFAENVFWAFWHARQHGGSAFTAFSPVTQRTYDVSCSPGGMVVCRAADGAEVRFPMAAVDAYTADQAARYAATHDTGSTTRPPTQDAHGSGAGTSGCDPNYKGACLDPAAADYDCAGGSGDGPEYTGPVEVVGQDHYGLDADGDGFACQS